MYKTAYAVVWTRCPTCGAMVKGRRSHEGTIDCLMGETIQRMADEGWCPIEGYYNRDIVGSYSVRRVRAVLKAYGAAAVVGPSHKDVNWSKKRTQWVARIWYRTRDLKSAYKWLDYAADCTDPPVPAKIIARAMSGDTKPLYALVDHHRAVHSLEG